MVLGTIQYIIECVPRDGPGYPFTDNVPPCTNINNYYMMPKMVQAYVIDPASASFLDAVAQPFDYAVGSQFFVFGFTSVASIYLLSHAVGLVLKMVRDG